MTDEIRYQPKGGMCLSCIALYDNCKSLPFEAMPQLSLEREDMLIANADMHVFNDKADLFDWLMEHFEDTN